MELEAVSSKRETRLPRKPERPYVNSLKSYSMEARRRPLRTYSKRTSSSEPVEPARKRRCISGSESDVSGGGRDQQPVLPMSVTTDDTTTAVVPAPSSPTAVKKGTITAYFQRSDPLKRSSTPAPEEPSSEITGPTVTPPSSPPILLSTTRKRVRRLKTRVTTHRISDGTEPDEDGDAEEQRETKPIMSPPILSEAAASILNISTTKTSEAKRRKCARERKKKPSVQTTLSLSMRDTAYTECKECDMLYNHLDKTDVKYHARHHAAKLKAKTNAGVEGDGEE
ncbi:hypothetical protein F5Y17DRAFT_446829 [Xylariaceae sp. FL0594]|nr:hypothetical protein F5Y17DRAFT_446829 [Xylariaceae sp. FL0594]